ncbi:MAG: gluconate 2-dehydrogenase subunit 3 family protein [Bacteroidota bacterium]
MEQDQIPSTRRKGYISRRDFLKITLLSAAGAGLAACQPNLAKKSGVEANMMGLPDQYPEIPFAPSEPPPYILTVLSSTEAKTVDALTARIYPGDASDPGAREAGVTNFIDKQLAFHDGYVEYTYIHPPHAKTYEGNQPPDQKTDELGEIIWVKKSEIERYGYQSLLKPTERYHAGLASVDAYSKATFGRNFVDLTEDQQDQVLTAMGKGDAADFFKDPTDKQFFKMLQDDTIQGMYSDPAYGGNKDMVGWKQIGYPGAQRAYTETDMNTEGPVRPPQSLAMLHAFHGGMKANSDVIMPQSGSELTPAP